MIAPRRRALVLLLGLGLAGCGGLGGGPAPKLYTLTAEKTFPASLPSAKGQMLIEVPAAPGSLDTERIALMKSPISVDYFADAAWTDRAPIMVQGLLIESFENSGKIGAIGRETVALRADYVLKPELRDFEAVYSGSAAPVVRIRLGLKLVRMTDRAIIAQRSIEVEEPAQQNTIESVIDAFNAGLHRAMGEVVAWTLPALARG